MNTAKMRCIGRGAFSTAYRKSKCKVLIKSRDFVKECMSFGCFPNSLLFPKITRVGLAGVDGYAFYEMKYYPKVISLKNNLDPFEWEFYKALRDRDFFWNSKHRVQDQINSLPNKFNRRKTVLLEAYNTLWYYRDRRPSFEISPRNVAVNNNKLILLDCFYFQQDLYYS